jgi:4-diphosphocytidyl-2-C-methyl-D-erythritol kinase
MTETIKIGCKINAYLKVVERLPNGYHNLSSLFLPLSYPNDTISIDYDSTNAKDGEIITNSLGDSNVPSGEDNIVTKAAKLYCQSYNITPKFEITIEKMIPSAAGLGGGSADAAAILNLLEKKYHFAKENLPNLAVKIGADVPFFLKNQPAVVTGIGQNLQYVDNITIPPLILVSFDFPVSAKWAYTHLDKNNIGVDNSNRLEKMITALKTNNIEMFATCCHNDLAIAVMEKFPLLRLVKEDMLNAGALTVLMSGSGPTLFAVAKDYDTLLKIQEAAQKHSHVKTFIPQERDK